MKKQTKTDGLKSISLDYLPTFSCLDLKPDIKDRPRLARSDSACTAGERRGDSRPDSRHQRPTDQAKVFVVKRRFNEFNVPTMPPLPYYVSAQHYYSNSPNGRCTGYIRTSLLPADTKTAPGGCRASRGQDTLLKRRQSKLHFAAACRARCYFVAYNYVQN